MKILITGMAGFIGFSTAWKLISHKYEIIGIDNLCNYYDVSLKKARLKKLENRKNINFYSVDIADNDSLSNLFSEHKFDIVLHLAAQVGVRYSIENPAIYARTNLIGFINILENCRKNEVKHLIYASSSSVYGLNTKIPFSTRDSADQPVSFYAATKKSNELMAHSYSYLYGIPTTGLRFFTVYGPWGRPDMAPFKFANAIFKGEVLDIYNNGEMSRDFTYIDDIVEGIICLIETIPMPRILEHFETGNPETNSVPYAIYNIGYGRPVNVMDFIQTIAKAVGKEAICRYMPMQLGDMKQTYADIEEFSRVTSHRPKVDVENGVFQFVKWYRDYYNY